MTAASVTTLQAAVGTIWSEVLEIEVGEVDQDFFALGGDSIRAAAVVARLRAVHGAELTLADFVEEPTVAGLAAKLDQLRHAPREPTLGPGRRGGEPRRAPSDSPVRASYAQERFWFIDQASGSDAVSNVSWAVRLRGGPVDPARLERAFTAVVARHETLRCHFEERDGHPVQVIAADPGPFELDRRVADDEAVARQLAAAEAGRSFTLTRGPLLRAQLIRLGPEDHVLHFVAHHIICDDWSKGVIMAELGGLYGELAGGDPARLPDPAVQYPAYAEWQRERLGESELAAELQHWQGRLAGAAPALELAPDRRRARTPSLNGARLRTTVPPAIAAELRAIGQAAGATHFMTMLAALEVLLYRYTRQEDITIGTAVDNRGRVELEGAVGLFTNVLALRADLSGRPSFRDLLSRARVTTLDAIAHQELPFDRLAAVTPERDPSRHPIFQAFYEFIVPSPVHLPIPGVDVEPFEIPKLSSEFDLGLYLDEQFGGLDAVWEYATDLFDASTIERLAGHFIALLQEIAADPDRPVDELPLLEATDHAALAPAAGGVAAIGEDLVHHRFAAWARDHPEDTAVIVGGEARSYAELDARANQIAHRLIALGASPGDAVGVCLERSTDLIAGLLGILKTGAAYVPLQPDHPAARRVGQLDSAGVRILLSDRALDAFGGRTLSIDDPELTGLPAEDPKVGVTLDDVAYVLFTSGSTGTPKGVAVTHRNVLNYTEHILATVRAHGLQFGSVSSVATDLGNTAIFPALAGGGCLHLIPTEIATDAVHFAEYVAAHPLDVLKITPSHLGSLLDATEAGSILPRGWLIVGGEPFGWELAERLLGDGGPTVVNHYGPTEATIGCCTFPLVPGAPRAPSATVPIGRPITNVTAHVLDPLGAPVPIGVPGELHIGGAGVARGYVNQPEQTAQVFVEDRFGANRLGRLYRTGDLVRRLPSGDLEFLGRADQQVKIRGYRVEPAEVQAALLGHLGRGQAAVVPHGEGDARRLVAYVVGIADVVDLDRLRDALEHELPPYMVPAQIVRLDELPLTPNGKLDRGRLPDPAAALPPAEKASAEALTGVEAQLAEIWQDLLEHDVGPEENFFEIGGHSLLAIRLVARLRGDLKVKLTLKALIDAPTIRQLAATIEAKLDAPVAAAPVPEPAPVPGAPPASALPAPAASPVTAAAPVPEPEPVDEAPIPLTPRDRPLRASFVQEQLWLVDQLTPGSTAYNFSWPMHLRGPLDVAALGRAVAELVSRHEALRTRLVISEDRPVQIVDPVDPAAVWLRVSDLTQAPDPEAEAHAIIDEQTRTPFDLSSEPLVRFGLLVLAPQHHVLQVVVHHIVFDGVSKIVLFEQLSDLYTAFAGGAEPDLAPPALQYADFAEWQRTTLTSERLSGELEHWRRELAGMPAALELPSDRPRPAVASLRGARLRRPLAPALRDAVEQLARSNQSTFFTAALAAFDVLLHRYTGLEDIVVGAPVDTRSRPELAGVIGPFINTVVLRNDLSGSPSFRQLLARVQGTTLEAVQHQELPFERLVGALAPERDLSRHPIFQTLLALNPPEPGLTLPGLAVEDIDPAWSASRVDLFLVLDDLATGMETIWEYSTDLFDPETIERMASHFTALLEAVVAEPDRPIGELPLLGAAERTQLLTDWNRTQAPFPDRRLEELIAAQAARTPDRVAVAFEGETLSYAELDARANQLAHQLRGLGVGPDDLVGICLPRSERLHIALLATMKSGGAYVPIDPTYPADRRRHMLEDARVSVLITESGVIEHPPAVPHLIELDAAQAELATQPTSAPPSGADAEGLAYVIYTSGSTGRPKGVEVSHRALVNFLTSMGQAPGLTADDVLIAVTTLSFDIAGLELYLPLIRGARVVLASAQTAADPSALARLIRDSGATVMQATPTTWRMLLDGGWPGVPGLKALCGGEALPVTLAGELIEHQLELWNMYGPTETTIWSTCTRLDTVSQPLTIGRPIANTTLYILDHHGEPTPVGVPGELLIGGAGLARGYRNRPDLTAERFIADAFTDDPGARLYRTGDLARYRPDGSVDFLGRLDQQVKLRGFRIELGEIETRLAEDPSVAAAAAAVHTTGSGEPALAAYVVGAGSSVDLEGLRRSLIESLPAYMVPARIVELDALPLTPNGKLDRQALPAPQDGGAVAGRERVAPRNRLEGAVAEVWRDLLGIDTLGVTDDFFELGGQSLLAVRLMRRLHSRFGVELPLRALFEEATVAALSARIQRSGVTLEPAAPAPAAGTLPAPAAGTLPALLPAVRTRRASYAQERFWFIDQVSGGSAAYNIAWQLRMCGALDVAALQRALNELVRRHEVLRTRFVEQDGRPVALVDPPTGIEFAFSDLSENSAEADRESQARQILDAGTATAFDISAGPVLRARLLRLGAEDHILQLVVHHIAADGGSKAIIFAELRELYAAFLANRPVSLAEPHLQYADFAEWEASWLQGERIERELDHWTDALAGAQQVLELATDRPRPGTSSLAGAWHRTTLPAGLLDDLQRLAREHGASLFMVMLAAFEVLLYRYSNQDDLLIGTPVDTRSRAELEPLVGPFVNSVVIRAQLADALTFGELLSQVRSRTLDALEHQELPFERLVERLAPDRDLSRHPLFQAQIALNPPEPELALAGLGVEEIETAKTTSRVDLTLLLSSAPGRLDAVWEYSTDLFDAATIDGMSGHFTALLEAIVADPEVAVGALHLLTDSERAELLGRFSARSPALPIVCLHERFEAQAEARPDAVALLHQGRSLTYGELNARANRLAHHLRASGVGPDTLVGLCLERSFDAVVAIIAVLKAGGAYLPLDPDQPAERLAFVLADSDAGVLVTHEGLLPRIRSHRGVSICLDRDAGVIEDQSSANPDPLATPENLAYVIYTSGSTGQPKGVLVEHRNVARLFGATEPWLQAGPGDTWTLLHSYAFDFSVWELWGALLHGGRLVVVPTMTTRSPEALAALLAEAGVTVLNATPSLFLTAMDELIARADTLVLRLVIFGGEALHPRLLRPWFDRFGDTEPVLVNMYGITETTVHVTYRRLSADDATRDGSPIGVPLPDLELYLLDPALNPVPVGVPGELYVGGAGVTRGYLNRPELTAERFLASPFGSGTLYRTGDRGRWTRAGELLHEGRLDDQVKIRGFRIELGEIQAALGEHPAVAECAVITVTDGPGGVRLAAYVVPTAGSASPGAGLIAELRDWLRQKLPEYMVPASFTALGELPLTVNGKLDRRALPAPIAATADGGSAPATAAERAIAEIWRELLGDRDFGREQDFFDLGGHSLLAAQLVARIRARFQTRFPVRAVFESPTIAGLASQLEPAGSAPGMGPVPIRRRTDGQPAVLSSSQRQLWLIDQWDPGAPTYGVALAYRIHGELDLTTLATALEGLIGRHEVLRTVVDVRNDEPVPVVLERPSLDLRTIDLRSFPAPEREAEARRLATESARRPFDFARDPLLRARVILLGDADQLLMLETHHIAFDGWSERILLDELAALYRGAPLADLPLQFGDFALWQQGRLAGGELDAELDFWRRHLGGARTRVELPVDHPRPEGLRFTGSSHDLSLDRSAAEAAAALGREESVTPYMLVLATLATLLYRITGQDDLLIGSPAANRGSVELESLIGFVSNTLVFRVRMGGNPTFRELLARVRAMALDVLAHQEVPLEQVVEAVRPEREPGVNPLFQVNLRVSPNRRSTLDLPGMTVTALKLDSGLSRFDLALDLDVLEDAIDGYFRYNRDIFEPATIARLSDEFAGLLRTALQDPDRRLLSFALTGEWSGPARPAAPGPRARRSG